MTPNPPSILNLNDVSVSVEPPYEGPLKKATLVLRPSELVCVRVGGRVGRFVLADVAEGLLAPEEGVVEFLGEDWRALPPDRAARARARIGRVFESHGWLSNLDMDENITLPQRVHARRPPAEILAEAEALARSFGLPGLPPVRPSTMNGSELRRCEWVRAFAGHPDLVLLEDPLLEAGAEYRPALLAAVRALRARGGAGLWIASLQGLSSDVSELEPTRIFQVRGGVLEAAG